MRRKSQFYLKLMQASIYAYYAIDIFKFFRFFLPTVVTIPPLIGFLISFMLSGMFQELWNQKSKYTWFLIGILLTSLHLFGVVVFQHGFSYIWEPYRFIRSIPYLLMGMACTLDFNLLKNSLRFIFFSNIINNILSFRFSVQYQLEHGIVAGRALHRQSTANLSLAEVSFSQGWSQTQSLVYVFLISLIYIILTLILNKSKKNYLLFFGLIPTVSLILSGGFLTAIICFMFSLFILCFLFFINDFQLFQKRIAIFLLRFFAILSIAYVAYLGLLSQVDNLPSVENGIQRLENIKDSWSSSRTLEGDPSAEGRGIKNMLSLTTFLEHPDFGVGHRLGEYTLVGGHSQFLDWLANFGLVGAIGPLILILFCINSSSKLMASKNLFLRRTGIVLFCLWLTIILNSFLGYVFLEPAIVPYTFYALGITVGMTIFRKNRVCS